MTGVELELLQNTEEFSWLSVSEQLQLINHNERDHCNITRRITLNAWSTGGGGGGEVVRSRKTTLPIVMSQDNCNPSTFSSSSAVWLVNLYLISYYLIYDELFVVNNKNKNNNDKISVKFVVCLFSLSRYNSCKFHAMNQNFSLVNIFCFKPCHRSFH